MREKRTCEPFYIPGTTVTYKVEGFIFSGKGNDERFPVLDMSCGGLRFLHDVPLKTNARVTLQIIVPGEDTPLVLRGRVCSAHLARGQSYNYQIEVLFDPYSKEKGYNNPCLLLSLMTLEEKSRWLVNGKTDQ